MNSNMNWNMMSRALIGLLFVVAGVGKVMGFAGTVGYVGTMLPMPELMTAIAIFIEIVVAAVWVWGGYKKDEMGWVLIGFTALATVLFHNNLSDQMQMIMALKNVAIIGGILAHSKCCK
jgi:putative oxidoreductase